MDSLRVEGRKKGLLDVGYHLVIDRMGAVHLVRDVLCVGSHTPGYNHISVGVCLIGGRSPAGEAVDDFTASQRASMVLIGAAFLTEWPHGLVRAHHELRGYDTTSGYRCPAMTKDALRELREATQRRSEMGCRLLSLMFKPTPRSTASGQTT